MKYKIHSFNFSKEVFTNCVRFNKHYLSVLDILDKISDEEIIKRFELLGKNSKSISSTITSIIEENLIESEWTKEPNIFIDFITDNIKSKRWTLDFYKEQIQLEIAFNHEEGTAWNLIKFQIAHQSNKFKHNQNVEIGIIITATNQFKKSGGFDNSVGSFEKYLEYLNVMKPFISIPILIIGLQSPEDFKIRHRTVLNKKIGRVREV